MAKRRKMNGGIARPVTAQTAVGRVALESPRRMIDIQNRYDGASDGRRMGAWQPGASGPNRALQGLQKLRNRNRDAVRNEWQSASALRVRITNVIGTGITPRWVTKDKARKEKFTTLWKAFTKAADADGLLDYYGWQALGARCRAEGGEVFVRARPRRLGSGFGVPVQFQLLEPEMCPLLDADTWPGMPQGNKLRQGVEFNRMGQRVAYWFYKEHPGDFFSGSIGMNDLIRVTSEYIKHVFRPERVGQIRGVPSGATNLAKIRVTTDFDDAVLARQHTANLFTGFIKKQSPTPDGIDPLTGKAIDYDSGDTPMASLEPGVMQELLPGEDVVFATPPGATAGYAEFMRYQTLGISAAEGIPYELLTGDLKDVSDRTLRAILNEFQRMCEQEQWHIIIPGLCDWVLQQWVKYSVLAGDLLTSEAADAADVMWSPQAWKYLHPVQDIQARQNAVDGGFRSRSSVIAEGGDDPEAVDAERKADQEREIALGLSFGPVDPNAPPPVDPAVKANTDKANAETKKVKAQETLILAQARRELRIGEAEANRLNAEAKRLTAESDLAVAKSAQLNAESAAITARIAMDESESAARIAEHNANVARADAESAATIANLEEAARLAREEADRKAKAHGDAEAFAELQRDLVLKAEQKRVDMAELERQAAEAGLKELAG